MKGADIHTVASCLDTKIYRDHTVTNKILKVRGFR